jgi:hypothetical protein
MEYISTPQENFTWKSLLPRRSTREIEESISTEIKTAAPLTGGEVRRLRRKFSAAIFLHSLKPLSNAEGIARLEADIAKRGQKTKTKNEARQAELKARDIPSPALKAKTLNENKKQLPKFMTGISRINNETEKEFELRKQNNAPLPLSTRNKPRPFRLEPKYRVDIIDNSEASLSAEHKKAQSLDRDRSDANKIINNSDVYAALTEHILREGKATNSVIYSFLANATNQEELTSGITNRNIRYAVKELGKKLAEENFVDVVQQGAVKVRKLNVRAAFTEAVKGDLNLQVRILERLPRRSLTTDRKLAA